MMSNRSSAPTTLAGLALFLVACGQPAPRAPQPEPSPSTREAPPPPLPVKDVEFPDYTERTLRNGARLVVVRNAEQPVASVQLLMPGGSAADPAGMAGLASVTASQVDKGTRTRSAQEIAEAGDFIGARLSAGAASEWTSVSLTVLTEFLEEGLGLMSDMVMNPTFPADELETETRRRVSSLRLNRSQPGSLAQEYFLKGVYGEHPYGQTPTAETIGAIGTGDLERFHARYYRPGGALFVAAGDVDPERIARQIELAFAGWEGQVATTARAVRPPSRTGRSMVFVHKPGSVQATFRVGHLLPSATDADWVRLDVTNQILGSPSAGFNAWLIKTLRDERGYTYGAYSIMSEREGPGHFWMGGEFRNEVADSSMILLLELAERLRSGEIEPDDLEGAKSYLTGSFPLSIETPQQVASQVASNRLLGRPDSYIEEYRGRVAGVSVADVAAAAREYIRPDEALIVVVGDATEVLDQVRPFAGEVTVIDTEGNPVDVDAIMAAAAASAELTFDASALQPRTMVYGLRLGGNEVAATTTHWQRDGESFVVVSELPGGMTQTTRFLARSFSPQTLVMQLGAMGEFGVTVAEGRAAGQTISQQGPQDVDMAFPEGTLLDGMQDVAFAVNSFDDIGDFTLKVLTGQGEIQGTAVRVTGQESVETPAGTFQTYKLDVGGPQPMTVWVTQSEPHIVVKREIAGPGGQTIEVVLKSMQ